MLEQPLTVTCLRYLLCDTYLSQLLQYKSILFLFFLNKTLTFFILSALYVFHMGDSKPGSGRVRAGARARG